MDGVVGPQTRPALVALMRVRRATWYGPGLYGNRTACGGRLRPATLGVAHKTLPCGTPVTFYHRGRFVTVAVIDRGPFRNGVAWDLTAAAARQARHGQHHPPAVRFTDEPPAPRTSRRTPRPYGR